MESMRKFSVTIKTQLEGMLKVDNEFETRSRSSIVSILEDLVQLRRAFLRKQSDSAVSLYSYCCNLIPNVDIFNVKIKELFHFP